jgi:Reverse transcriptase (RNA-dependent DNA polymerase)
VRYTEETAAALKAPSRFDPDMPSVAEALRSENVDKWMKPMHSELNSLREMGTCKLVSKAEVSAGIRILPCKLVLKIKKHGAVDRYKARLVILGTLHQAGIDYDATFAPVVDFTIVRLMLAIEAKSGYQVHQMGVKTAFLNGDVDADVYMCQPKGFKEHGVEDKVCHLQRSLYGMKQAPTIWYERLWTDLTGAGFQTSRTCAFVFKQTDRNAYVLVHVDDLLVIGRHDKEVAEAKVILSDMYQVKDMVVALYFLGVGVRRGADGSIAISQVLCVSKDETSVDIMCRRFCCNFLRKSRL